MKRFLDRLLPFGSFLYILQKEEYDASRYLKWLPRFFFRRNFPETEKVEYTPRARIIVALAALMFLVALYLGFSAENFFELIGAFLFIPVFMLFAHLLTAPLFFAAKLRLRQKAEVLVHSRKELRVVAIAGSYGKTTTKYFLYELARHAFKTQIIPENINTTTGIARWLTRKLESGTKLLIYETDAYAPGEISATARMAPPDVAIITSVGDQHLERFGSLESLARTLLELFQYAKEDAKLVLHEETVKRLPLHELALRARVLHGVPVEATPSAAGLSPSNQKNLALALEAAKLLGVPERFIEDAVPHLAPPERRQAPGIWHGYDIIDDSYNISLSTADAGLTAARAFADAKGKKLLVVAAGIPELGPEDGQGNRKLGALIAAKADSAAVLSSMFAPEILKGLANAPHRCYPRLANFIASAHADYPPEEWVVLLQPALTDLYY